MKTLERKPTAETDTDVADASAKLLAELHARQAELEEAITSASRRQSLQDEAQLLIIGSPSRPRPDVRQLVRQREVTEEAIRLQSRIVEQLRARERQRQRLANQPEHAARLRSLRDALLQAEKAAAELETFYNATDNLVGRSMRFPGFGDFNPQTGRCENVQRWILEAEEHHVFKDSIE